MFAFVSTFSTHFHCTLPHGLWLLISISRAAFGTFDTCRFLCFSACLLPMLAMLLQLQQLETMPRPAHKGMNRNNNNNCPETESNATATATALATDTAATAATATTPTAARIFQCSQMRIEAPTSAPNDSALWLTPPFHIPLPHPATSWLQLLLDWLQLPAFARLVRFEFYLMLL